MPRRYELLQITVVVNTNTLSRHIFIDKWAWECGLRMLTTRGEKFRKYKNYKRLYTGCFIGDHSHIVAVNDDSTTLQLFFP